ncbi:MAG: PIN domain-containing protein [Nitrospirota bacterium]
MEGEQGQGVKKDKDEVMKVVLDTNIVFSAMLQSGKRFRDILFFENAEFYSCKYLIIELFKHKEKIVKYSELREEVVLEILYKILKNIHFINEDLISEDNLIVAYNLCKKIDEKDTMFVALTLELDGVLWTSDKRLKKGLQKKGFGKFFEKKI